MGGIHFFRFYNRFLSYTVSCSVGTSTISDPPIEIPITKSIRMVRIYSSIEAKLGIRIVLLVMTSDRLFMLRLTIYTILAEHIVCRGAENDMNRFIPACSYKKGSDFDILDFSKKVAKCFENQFYYQWGILVERYFALSTVLNFGIDIHRPYYFDF